MKHVKDRREQGDDPIEGEQHIIAAAGSSAVPRTRTRLTGDDLEARFDGWAIKRRQRRQERSEEDVARTMRRGAGVILGLGIVALVVTSGVSGEINGSTSAANTSRIDELQQQLVEIEAEPVDTNAGTAMAEVTDAAAADAKTVAVEQQEFSTLYYQASTQPTNNNGSPNKPMLQTAEHRKDLAPFFAESSYVVEGDAAYRWETVDPYDTTTQIDPRFAWYVRYDGAKAKNPDSYTWQVESVTPDLDQGEDATQPGSGQSAQVVWTCRDTQTKTVLAWASARYTRAGETGTFDKLELVVTSAGAQDAPTTGHDKSVTVPEIGELGQGTEAEEKK
ncbi:MAG: hypothetical protein DI630_30605 [Gordonia sp. (in: high G+C Gram-positive bacteria)]|nr:MAG: hypothetical protein DI630_30605 [Gordonia sp. (in: high G+C Gram-positive bacteria)]